MSLKPLTAGDYPKLAEAVGYNWLLTEDIVGNPLSVLGLTAAANFFRGFCTMVRIVLHGLLRVI